MNEMTPGDLRRGYGPIYRRLSRCGTEIGNPAKLVLLNLLERLGQNSAVWPSQETIGSDTDLGDRQVRSALRELENLGFLSSRRRGQGRPNVYALHIGQILRWADPRTGKSALLEVPHAPVLPIEGPTKEDPPVKATRTASSRRVTEFKPLTDDQRAKLLEDFRELPAVEETIAFALTHDAHAKCSDEYLYLRRWLREDLTRFLRNQPQRKGVSRGPASRDPEAFLDPETLKRSNVRVFTD